MSSTTWTRRRGAHAVLAGLGTWAPPGVVTNADLAQRMDTSDEWIVTRTGIRERRWAEPGTTTLDLATEAGARAMKSAGVDGVDAVIMATTTPDRLCPGTGPELATRLGLTGVAAFDVQAVCSGFLYGLASATGLIAAGVAGRVLLVAAEVISPFLDPEDRGVSVIFGDGAGAVVLRAGEEDEPGAVGAIDLGSDGSLSTAISLAAGGSRLPTGRGDGTRHPEPSEHYLRMDGREVYRHAVPRMTESCRKVLDAAGWTVDDVDRFVGHQANVRILSAVGDRLGVPQERRTVNIHRYGNTSAASVPLALADAELTGGERVLVTAFGGGLTWGSAVLTWPHIDAT